MHRAVLAALLVVSAGGGARQFETTTLLGRTDRSRQLLRPYYIPDGQCDAMMTADRHFGASCRHPASLLVDVRDHRPYPTITVYPDLRTVIVQRARRSDHACPGHAAIRVEAACDDTQAPSLPDLVMS